MDSAKVNRMERDKVEKFSLSGSNTSGIILKSPE